MIFVHAGKKIVICNYKILLKPVNIFFCFYVRSGAYRIEKTTNLLGSLTDTFILLDRLVGANITRNHMDLKRFTIQSGIVGQAIY